jgi:hypothetical protein
MYEFEVLLLSKVISPLTAALACLILRGFCLGAVGGHHACNLENRSKPQFAYAESMLGCRSNMYG